MGFVIVLLLAAVMLGLLWLSVRRRRRTAAGLPVGPAFSERIAAFRMRRRSP